MENRRRKKIIFNIINNEIILISDFIKIFPLAWSYFNGMSYDSDTGKKYYSEDAIWSKLCHPTEVFLIPNVAWTHIYTWPDWFDKLLLAEGNVF